MLCQSVSLPSRSARYEDRPRSLRAALSPGARVLAVSVPEVRGLRFPRAVGDRSCSAARRSRGASCLSWPLVELRPLCGTDRAAWLSSLRTARQPTHLWDLLTRHLPTPALLERHRQGGSGRLHRHRPGNSEHPSSAIEVACRRDAHRASPADRRRCRRSVTGPRANASSDISSRRPSASLAHSLATR